MTKVAFFGTSDRSLSLLESLKNNFELVLCVTKAQVLVGRHQIAQEPAVKRWANTNGVNLVTINKSLIREIDTIIEQIKSSKAEVGVVADFSFMLPPQIINIFPRGLINVHFSLLPKYRGASPVQFAILHEDAETGITYQLITAGLDQGPILKQIPYPLNGTETSESLYRALFDLAAQQLPAVLNDYLADKLPPKPQDESRVSYTYSSNRPESTQISKEDAKINWSASTNKIYAAIRAYNPWPIAWTTLEELTEAKEKVAELTALKDPQNASKTVKIYSASLLSDRTLLVDKLQVAGGKVLTWQEFKNGYLA